MCIKLELIAPKRKFLPCIKHCMSTLSWKLTMRSGDDWELGSWQPYNPERPGCIGCSSCSKQPILGLLATTSILITSVEVPFAHLARLQDMVLVSASPPSVEKC